MSSVILSFPFQFVCCCWFCLLLVCLLHLAETSCTMLKWCESRYPSVLSDLKDKAFSLSSLSKMLIVDFFYRCLYFPSLLHFYHEQLLDFCQVIFLCLLRWLCACFLFILLIRCIILIDICVLNQPCFSEIKPT